MTMQAHLHQVAEIRREDFGGFKTIHLEDRDGSQIILFINDNEFDEFAGKMMAAVGHPQCGLSLSLPEWVTPEDEQAATMRLTGAV